MTKFKPGDAVLVPNKKGKPYEAYVVWPRSYQEPGTICVYMNWDGDGVYVDPRPEELTSIPIGQLSRGMRLEAIAIRQRDYLGKTS